MQFRFNALSNDEIRRLLLDVSILENLKVDPADLEGMIAQAKGMPRKALVLLQEAIHKTRQHDDNQKVVPLLDKVVLGD
jgi:DNA polymerase III gamma/tau subunit